jgi:hypothetical protein
MAGRADSDRNHVRSTPRADPPSNFGVRRWPGQPALKLSRTAAVRADPPSNFGYHHGVESYLKSLSTLATTALKATLPIRSSNHHDHRSFPHFNRVLLVTYWSILPSYCDAGRDSLESRSVHRLRPLHRPSRRGTRAGGRCRRLSYSRAAENEISEDRRDSGFF